MNSPSTPIRRARRLAPALTAICASLVLAACGSTSTTTSTTTASTAGGTASRTALTQCLKNHGVTLPARAGGGGTSGAPNGQPPTGATGAGGANSSARQAALKACGVTGRHFGGGASTTTTG
jgi:hypothetical protein